MEKKVKGIKIITILISIIMFACIIILACEFVKIANLKHKSEQLSVRKEQLVSEIYNYNTSNDYYNNNRQQYLEDYAREMLNWGEQGEIWYTKE